MKIKHWQGYGTVNAKKLTEYPTGVSRKKTIIQVTGNHEWGIERMGIYAAYDWLKQFLPDCKASTDIVMLNLYDAKIKDENGKEVDSAVYEFEYYNDKSDLDRRTMYPAALKNVLSQKKDFMQRRFYIVPATKTYFDTINAEDKNDAIAAFADSMCLDMSAYFDATEEEPVTYPHAYEHAGNNFEVAMSIIIDTMTSNKKSPYFQKDGLPEINLSDDDFRILGDLQRAYEAIKSIPDRYKIKYRKRFYRLLQEFTGFKFDKKEFGEEGVE